MTARVSNNEDYLDTRDIIERIEELESRTEDDEADELAMLKALIEKVRSVSEDTPEDGCQLIRDSYFEEYAEEFAADIGAINENAQWPLNYIDWAAAADQLQMDYSEVDFDGVTYWVR